MPNTGLFLLGVLLPLLAFQVKMITEVRNDGIYLKFIPFHFTYRHFPYRRIREYKKVTFHSLKEFGGWGIRINLDGRRLYNIAGNEGIELRLASGNTVLIGTRNPEALKKALDMAET